MLQSIHVPEASSLVPKIVVIGVGGAGCNAVSNMRVAKLEGVDFVVANTDAQSLAVSLVDRSIQLGVKTTQGLGAGADPEIGKLSAEESRDTIAEQLEGAHLCFITAGMGGGTGTGAAPVVAEIAREKDILTVGVVTKPFSFEGSHRAHLAEHGVEQLRKVVHTLVVIPNQNLFKVANESLSFKDVCHMADEVLLKGIRSITDLMTKPGLINLDFADVRAVLLELGNAVMGTGEAEGDDRAREAARMAMDNKLLEDFQLSEAKGVLINVIGGNDLSLMDVQTATDTIKAQIGDDVKIMVGSTIDQDFDGKVKVTLIATGLRSPSPDFAIDHDFGPIVDEVEVDDDQELDGLESGEPVVGYVDDQDGFGYGGEERVSAYGSAEAVLGAVTDDGLDDEAAGDHPGFPRREYVAPKVADRVPDIVINDHESEVEDLRFGSQPSPADRRGGERRSTGFGAFRSVIGRMTNSASVPGRNAADDPRFDGGSDDEQESHEDSRRIPAYARRQAN